MKTLPIIALDSNWFCQQPASAQADYRGDDPDSAWQSLRSLNGVKDWSALTGEHGLWLRRDFTLTALDVCVRYYLDIDSLPGRVHIYVNGHDAGEHNGPGRLDVTDFVTLDRNRLAIRLDGEAHTGFGALRLRAVPCESGEGAKH